MESVNVCHIITLLLRWNMLVDKAFEKVFGNLCVAYVILH